MGGAEEVGMAPGPHLCFQSEIWPCCGVTFYAAEFHLYAETQLLKSDL